MEGFQPYTQDVYGWAYRLLGRHHDALDVVQDVFLKWSRQCTTATPRQPRGWLRRVTWNRAIDLARRRRREPDTELRIAASITEVDAVVDQLDRDALRCEIGEAMNELSDAQRRQRQVIRALTSRLNRQGGPEYSHATGERIR